MYLNTNTKTKEAQALLDRVRHLALDIKGNATIAWAWTVTSDLIKVEAHVTDFQVIYVLSDIGSAYTTTSYREAIAALSAAL
jgi:hypothetical protein